MAELVEAQEAQQEKHVDDEVQHLPLDLGTRRKGSHGAQNPADNGGHSAGTNECSPGHITTASTRESCCVRLRLPARRHETPRHSRPYWPDAVSLHSASCKPTRTARIPRSCELGSKPVRRGAKNSSRVRRPRINPAGVWFFNGSR